MGDTTQKETNPPFDAEKYVKRMNYWIGQRIGDVMINWFNDISMNGEEGEFDQILECLKTNNFEFNLYDAWKEYIERDYDEEEVALWKTYKKKSCVFQNRLKTQKHLDFSALPWRKLLFLFSFFEQKVGIFVKIGSAQCFGLKII